MEFVEYANAFDSSDGEGVKVEGDIEMDSLNFDITKIEEKITSRTKAIFISPVLGNSPDMDYLLMLKEKYNIELILDGCDSLGSKWDGKELTEYVIASTCSFYASHHLCTIEGGMISSNDSELVRLARSIAWWGRQCRSSKKTSRH